MVLFDFPEPIKIVTDFQCAEKVVLHIETTEFIADDPELTLIFIKLQEINRNINHSLYITQVRNHTRLLGPLAQGNYEMILVGNVLEAS